MATLIGTRHKTDRYKIEFLPIEPSVSGLRDAYRILVHRNDKKLVDHKFNLRYQGWPIGHSEVESFGYILSQIRSLRGQRITNISPLKKPTKPTDYEKPCVFRGPEFFQVLLWEAPREEQNLFYFMFMIDDRALRNNRRLSSFFYFCGTTITCKARDLEKFGRQILKEFKVAQIRRVRLGQGRADDPEIEELSGKRKKLQK